MSNIDTLILDGDQYSFAGSGGGSDLYYYGDDGIDVYSMTKASSLGNNPEGFDTRLTDYPVTEDYIPLTDEYMSIVCNEDANQFGFKYAFYNSSKTYLSTINWGDYAKTMSSTTDKAYVYAVPSNAAFVRIQWRAYTMTKLKLYNRYLNSLAETTTLAWTSAENALLFRSFLSIPNNDLNLSGKKVLCIGDSITENNQHNNNKAWCEYLADIFGMDVYNDGKSGTGLIKGYGSYRGACNRVDSSGYFSGVTPDLILIMGNGNDATAGSFYDYSGNSVTVTNEYGANVLPIGTSSDTASTLSVYGAMKHLFNSLITKYPLAKIGFITSTPRTQDLAFYWGQDKAHFYGHGAFHDYVTAIKWVCDEYNIPCLDLYHATIFRPWNTTNANTFYADGETHPNTLGTVEGIVKPVVKWIWDNF